MIKQLLSLSPHTLKCWMPVFKIRTPQSIQSDQYQIRQIFKVFFRMVQNRTDHHYQPIMLLFAWKWQVNGQIENDCQKRQVSRQEVSME